jgi:RNA polymerase sigma factor (sigma-70 family)
MSAHRPPVRVGKVRTDSVVLEPRWGTGKVRRAERSFDDRVCAARGGDADAWSQLYYDVAPILIAYLRAQRLRDPEDVAGEVLLEVVRDLHRFTGDRQHFRSWVLAIAHHRLLDARRREQRRPSVPVPPDELGARLAPDDPEAAALATVGFGALEPALQTLTEDQRAVLLLRVVGDLSIADVALITGKRTGAVKQLQRRAVEAMRRALDAQLDLGRVERPTRWLGAPRTVGVPTAVADASPATGAQ